MTIGDICEILSYIGFAFFIIRLVILRKSPVPSGAFKKVPKELLKECTALLEERERRVYEPYEMPPDIEAALRENLRDEIYLKKLLCSICDHLDIKGEFIKLVVEDVLMTDRAGEITTDLAFTTIRLDMKDHYTLDAVAAVLAHEAVHLHLYYEGIRLGDSWENEILTDTAAVYCGFE